ncbi:hypothetical protein KC340_g11352 [Hortaea werneckii]|nr:hypothetical protein KC342_g11271 [Hortaea werneckii]KAI7096444.1 hypothetical protein KC339_g10377 [Hortaea werneckii]KAI7229843.1 hypothetical protein KC365_g7874 [Hortaea werneckii]KAI7307507.1 hypothetical protein KC340_g11352 [Hortaea werneckii]KAI7387023.1 hypothetical protein KC328_g9633 [Hortaea werneckii]
MAPRDFKAHPVTNLERFLVTRYKNAHELLETDVNSAEQELLSLLHEPRLPLWIRAQCNMLLAGLTEEYSEAMCYLRDARGSLSLFKETQDEVTPRMLQMEKDLDGLEVEIEERKDTGFQSGSDSTPSTPRAASPSVAREEFQLGEVEASQEEKGQQEGIQAANEDDEMLLGGETGATLQYPSHSVAREELQVTGASQQEHAQQEGMQAANEDDEMLLTHAESGITLPSTSGEAAASQQEGAQQKGMEPGNEDDEMLDDFGDPNEGGLMLPISEMQIAHSGREGDESDTSNTATTTEPQVSESQESESQETTRASTFSQESSQVREGQESDTTMQDVSSESEEEFRDKESV